MRRTKGGGHLLATPLFADAEKKAPREVPEGRSRHAVTAAAAVNPERADTRSTYRSDRHSSRYFARFAQGARKPRVTAH